MIRTKGFLILKSVFPLIFCQVLQGCLLFLGLRHVLYGASPLIQNKGYWFWNQILFWNASKTSSLRSFFVASGRHGHFEWLAFDTDQRFFDFKINFLFDFLWSASRFLIISRVKTCFLWWLAFDSEQTILILKPNFSLECIKCFKIKVTFLWLE